MGLWVRFGRHDLVHEHTEVLSLSREDLTKIRDDLQVQVEQVGLPSPSLVQRCEQTEGEVVQEVKVYDQLEVGEGEEREVRRTLEHQVPEKPHVRQQRSTLFHHPYCSHLLKGLVVGEM